MPCASSVRSPCIALSRTSTKPPPITAQALALAEDLGMRPLQAHCHLGLGVLYQRLGKREPAQAALSTAIELLRAMEMTFWLPRAEAELAQVAAH
jgi:hypothetical protein